MIDPIQHTCVLPDSIIFFQIGAIEPPISLIETTSGGLSSPLLFCTVMMLDPLLFLLLLTEKIILILPVVGTLAACLLTLSGLSFAASFLISRVLPQPWVPRLQFDLHYGT